MTFSLGLIDSVMVATAMLGSLLVPLLARGIGPPGVFAVSRVGVVAAQLSGKSARRRHRH